MTQETFATPEAHTIRIYNALILPLTESDVTAKPLVIEIGRASCRERV